MVINKTEKIFGISIEDNKLHTFGSISECCNSLGLSEGEVQNILDINTGKKIKELLAKSSYISPLSLLDHDHNKITTITDKFGKNWALGVCEIKEDKEIPNESWNIDSPIQTVVYNEKIHVKLSRDKDGNIIHSKDFDI